MKRVVPYGWMDRELKTVGQTDTQRHGKALCNFVNASKNIPCNYGCHMKFYIKNLAHSLLIHCDVLVMTMKHA
jgi:hypothetical protein